jgi:hypothetical protein
MSYSYVKTVFPNFKYSNVYDTKLYENLNVSQRNDTKLFEPADFDMNKTYSEIPKEQPTEQPKEQPTEQYKEQSKEQYKEQYNKIETFQNNQQFFNEPLPINNIPVNNNVINMERFDSEYNNTGHHIQYTKHVLECSPCKDLLMKQFGIENERIRNEEIMELISYLIFGLFILLLIDTYSKK